MDVYNVNFDNYVTTVAAANGDTGYENSGSMRCRGIESEAHLALGGGLTAVGNASLIRATFLNSDITSPIEMAGDTIPYAPSYIALAGLTYGNGPWGASLLTKFVGTVYQGKNGSADGSARQPSLSRCHLLLALKSELARLGSLSEIRYSPLVLAVLSLFHRTPRQFR